MVMRKNYLDERRRQDPGLVFVTTNGGCKPMHSSRLCKLLRKITKVRKANFTLTRKASSNKFRAGGASQAEMRELGNHCKHSEATQERWYLPFDQRIRAAKCVKEIRKRVVSVQSFPF
jgi:hypothetical protein